jgi:hypothetical protein
MLNINKCLKIPEKIYIQLWIIHTNTRVHTEILLIIL